MSGEAGGTAVGLSLILDGPAVQGQELGLQINRADRPIIGQPMVEIVFAGAVDARQRTIGTTDAAGRLLWTPEEAGLVQLELGGERVGVAVAPAGPVSGAATLGALALGLALVFGFAVRSRR